MGDSLLTFFRLKGGFVADVDVSIPFSWGTHFSRLLNSFPRPRRSSRLNPLLMGDSLLTWQVFGQDLRWRVEGLNPLLMGDSLLTLA